MPALPPGPALPALAQTLLDHRDPLGVLLRTRARYGPLFTLCLSLKGPMVVVAKPAELEPLLRSDPGSARAGAARRRILPLASPRSPFGADGEDHRAIRAVMEPAFAPARIAAHADEIAAIAGRHVAAWPAGAPFRLLPRMRAIATEVFVSLVLRVDDRARREAFDRSYPAHASHPGESSAAGSRRRRRAGGRRRRSPVPVAD